MSTFINVHENVKKKYEIHVHSVDRKSGNAFLRLDSLLDIYNEEKDVEKIQIDEVKKIDDGYRISGSGDVFTVHSGWKPVQDGCGYIQVDLNVTYNKEVSAAFGFRFNCDLLGGGKPTWMIPGAFYKENRFEHNARKYPRYDFRDGNHDEMVSDHWSFRSDRAALPAVFAWNDEMCGALCVEEMSEIGLTGVGFRGNESGISIWVNFPYKEEPVTFVGEPIPEPKDISLYTFKPGETIHLQLKIYTSSPDLH
ncbi:MAG: hypothetical protein ACXVNF_04830, partial [Neobacillus sp.]